jgi:NADH-quinone oxidoreductase subunit N
MYTKEPNEEEQNSFVIYAAVAVIAIVLNITLGLFPSLVWTC